MALLDYYGGTKVVDLLVGLAMSSVLSIIKGKNRSTSLMAIARNNHNDHLMVAATKESVPTNYPTVEAEQGHHHGPLSVMLA